MITFLCDECGQSMQGRVMDERGTILLFSCPCGISRVINTEDTPLSEIEELNDAIRKKFNFK